MGTNLLVMVGGAGLFQSLFMSAWVLSSGLGRRMSNVLLLALNLVILLFLANTIYLFISAGDDIAFLSNLSIASLLAVGPIILFYVMVFLGELDRFNFKHAIHIVPSLYVMLAGPGFCKVHLTFAGILVLAYIATSFVMISRSKAARPSRLWLYFLLGGMTLLMLLVTFFSVGKICIITISIGFTFIIYALTFQSVRLYKDIFKPGKKPGVAPGQLAPFEKQIVGERLYCDTELTLPLLASKLQTTPHRLSFVVNLETGSSFPDYINTLRVNEAKRMLRETEEKVAAIAYDCGFNSLSTFYAVFKKLAGCSPTEFRKR